MDLNFYSELSGACSQNVDPEFLDPRSFSEYAEEEHKFAATGDGYLTISGGGHSFLSAATFHTPSLGDEVFEIPPISLDPDSALSINDALSHFDLSDGSDDTTTGPSGSRRSVNNLVPEVSDPSFASTFVNTGSQVLDQLSRGVMNHAGGAALLSSSALELGNSSGSHFSSSCPMAVDVQLDSISHELLGSSQLTAIHQSELAPGHSESVAPQAAAPEQPLSATPSPAGSLHDEDMDDFKRSVLVDSPISVSSSSVLTQVSSHQFPQSSACVAAAVKDEIKPLKVASFPAPVNAKKGRKKKDPNEPQKPVSAYALFFRDTQAAIKGQNPNASFGEVSKIVASMWDSLADEQKQVYKKKTKVAKKDYLTALAAYKASQLSQSTSEELDASSTSPPAPVPFSGHQAVYPTINLEENTITNICASNITLDVPEITTNSQMGLNRVVGVQPAQTITKIIIPKHMLQAGGQFVTMLPAGVRTLHPTFIVSGVSRQPPPLQQMQTAPLPPRLQQMAPAPPPLQAKPREGTPTPGLPVSLLAAPPPPLQIKIVPASLPSNEVLPVIVSTTTCVSSPGATPVPPTSTTALHTVGNQDEDEVTEVVDSDEDVMEVTESWETNAIKRVCVRAGCNKPAVESEDWDREYCSNECVATHCRDVFQTWCSIRNQTMGTVE